MSEILERLKDYLYISRQYKHVGELMYWDMETTMPKAGFDGRSDAITYFNTELFKRGTAPELEDMLNELLKDE